MALHGKTKIELFKDSKPVLVHEESNIVTNLMADHLSAHCGPQYLVGNCNIPVSSLYKGLLLFKNSISEDADNYSLPELANTVIGRGTDSNVLSSDLDKGTFNTNLSTENNSHLHYVWDFDEEHGNGPISCVCLTMTGIADMFRKIMDSTIRKVPPIGDGFVNEPVFECLSQTTLPVFFDADTDTIYCITQISLSGAIGISKYAMNKVRPIVGSNGLKSFTPNNMSNRAIRLLTDLYATTVGSIDLSSYITVNGQYSGCAVTRDGYMYLFATDNETIATNGQLSMAKINLKTAAATSYTLTNYSNRTIKLFSTPLSGTNRYTYPVCRSILAHDGYFFVRDTEDVVLAISIEANSEYHAFVADPLEDSDSYCTALEPTTHTRVTGFTQADEQGDNGATMFGYQQNIIPVGPKTLLLIERITSNNESAYSVSIVSMNGWRRIMSIPAAYIFNSLNDATCVVGNIVVSSHGPNLGMVMHRTSWVYKSVAIFGGYFWLPNTVGLQTINNLDTQVIKTADMTMRITYDLEENTPVGSSTPESSVAENRGGDE